MTASRALTGRQLLAALSRLGFRALRVRGSHHYLRHDDGRCTVVPVHSGETIGRGLLAKILRDAEVKWNEIEELR